MSKYGMIGYHYDCTLFCLTLNITQKYRVEGVISLEFSASNFLINGREIVDSYKMKTSLVVYKRAGLYDFRNIHLGKKDFDTLLTSKF